MLRELDSFYWNKEEPYKACCAALRQYILSYHPDFSETLKYGMPCFCYQQKAFCYLWQDKKTREPYILMVRGAVIDHSSLEQGKRAKMKILRISPHQDLPIKTIQEIFSLALVHY